MFHYDDGLVLTRPRVAVDARRRQQRCFVSHAHADHMARHELAFATPTTAALYRHRMGPRLRVKTMPYGEAIALGDLRLTALPAGHCLGSAMLLAEQRGERLLYTGDFRLGPSLTAAAADPPRADVLVMESTFGRPEYRLPPREETVGRLIDLVDRTLQRGRTPVIHTYALGKSQEVTALLVRVGIPVLQHPTIYAVSVLYERLGVGLGIASGMCCPYDSGPMRGHAVLTLPRRAKGFRLRGLGPATTIAVTGWAMHPSTRGRLGVQHALPLSDHAGFDQLMRLPEVVRPTVVYCTHGPGDLVDYLRGAGYDARPLAPDSQRRLFR